MVKESIKNVHEILSYDEESGILTWKVYQGQAKAGKIAGTPTSDGYLKVGINGTAYLAHRLIWFIKKGYFPEGLVEHRDRIRVNNAWNNLREATQQCNRRNSGNPSNNTSGVIRCSIC